MEMLDWDGSDENKPRSFLQEMGDTLRSINKNFLTRFPNLLYYINTTYYY